jgi:hypothetical protein
LIDQERFRVQQDRTNTNMAQIIEQGLTRDLLHGSVVAWKFLASHSVPDEIILRVLTEPAMRRGTDTSAAIGVARALSPPDAPPPGPLAPKPSPPE